MLPRRARSRVRPYRPVRNGPSPAPRRRTGFYYYGYRYYDPVSGRWATRDPIEELGGENLYEYVFNDPCDQFDDSGLWPSREEKNTAVNSGREGHKGDGPARGAGEERHTSANGHSGKRPPGWVQTDRNGKPLWKVVNGKRVPINRGSTNLGTAASLATIVITLTWELAEEREQRELDQAWQEYSKLASSTADCREDPNCAGRWICLCPCAFGPSNAPDWPQYLNRAQYFSIQSKDKPMVWCINQTPGLQLEQYQVDMLKLLYDSNRKLAPKPIDTPDALSALGFNWDAAMYSCGRFFRSLECSDETIYRN